MLNKHARAMSFCTSCPKLCRFTCPVACSTGRETTSPWGRQTLLHLAREGFRDFDYELGALVYQCTTCLMCNRYCDHDIKVADIMIAARAEAVSRQVAPDAVRTMRDAFTQGCNPFGLDLGRVVTAATPEDLLASDAEVVLFPGCTVIHDLPEILMDTISVLRGLEIDYAAVFQGDVQCCGEPLRQAGLREQYQRHAETLFARLRRHRLVICACPACVYQFRVLYREMGLQSSTRFLHVSEFLWEQRSRLDRAVRKRLPLRACYHDPCYLGRYLGVYDEPRQVLAMVLEEPAAEFVWCRGDAACCGAGGGLSWSDPEAARRITARRLEEFSDTGADELVTACPTGVHAFRSARPDGSVHDLVSIVARSLTGGE
ncbi:(Fe-S)-binding protein [bacterium]|nr:(Fe-S)-binding protein [candidate division CSSED10-310 bacterium]